jgi:hypothetical protein
MKHMASTIKDAMEQAGVKAETSKGKGKATEKVETLAPAATWKEALGNVLLEVPKSARKLVETGTDYLAKSVMTNAHNSFACGELLSKMSEQSGEKPFARLINEVWSRFGLKRSTIYLWIRNSTVLTVAIPNDTARDAIIAVSGGRGLVAAGKDGEAPSLAGSYTAGIKKHPVPAKGTSYEDCLDWAREVQVIAERNANNKGANIADVFKAARSRFEVLLNGNRKLSANLKFATEFVVVAYRALEAKSAPCAMAAFAAIEDSAISPDAAGQNAMVELRHSQETEAAAKAAAEAATKVARKAPKTEQVA